MPRQSIISQAERALNDHGWNAAVTVLIGGFGAIAAATVRKAFTSEATVKRVLSRLDEWEDHRQRDREEINHQLALLNKRIDSLFDQRGHTKWP